MSSTDGVTTVSSCPALKRAGFVLTCCSSCHEDADYGYDLCEITLPDGSCLAVCCWVAAELNTEPRVDIAAALAAEGSAILPAEETT